MASQFVELKVNGLPELQAKLSKLAPRVARKALRAAVEAGGEVIRQAAETAYEPHRLTGFLEGHVVMKVTTKDAGARCTAIIGPQADVGYAPVTTRGAAISLETAKAHFPAIYAIWLEFGSKHQTASPCLTPAFQESAGEALDVFVETLWKGLQELGE